MMVTSFDHGQCLVCCVRDDHPAHYQVEEEHWVDCQHLPGGGVAVAQELHGGKGAPHEASQDNDTSEEMMDDNECVTKMP